MALLFSPRAGGDRVTYASQGNINGGAYSIVCDYYVGSTGASNDYIFSAHNSGSSGNVNMLLQVGTSGTVVGNDHLRVATFGGTTAELISAAGVLTTSAWNQVAFTWDGTSKFSAGSGNLYANSTTALTPDVADTTGSFGSTSGNWNIGSNGNANRAPDARIGRFAVVNKVITAAELELFMLGLPIRSIWLDSELTLVPSSDFNDNWDDDVNTVTATITGAAQTADATYPGSTIITAATGALALTGNAATTSTGTGAEVLTAVTGSLTLTGNAATTTASSSTVMTAETAALNLTGNTAGLLDITINDLTEGTSADSSACTISGTESDPVIDLDFHRSLTSTWSGGVVRLDNVSGKTSITLTFDGSTRSETFQSAQPVFQRLASGDYDDWTRVTSDVVAGDILTATVSSGLTGPLLVSNQPCVFPSDIEAYVAAQIAASTHVTSLVTGEETTGKYATLAATTGYGSKVIPSLDQHAFRITHATLDPVSFPVGSKPSILVLFGTHSGYEHIGQQAMIGLANWLVSVDPDAVLAIRNFNWDFVQVNPQGGWGANQSGGTWQATQPNVNTNREWDSALLTCVNNAKTYIANEVGTGNIKFLLDFHNLLSGNGVGTSSSIFMIDTRPNTQNFFDRFNTAYTGATFLENAGSVDAGIAPNYYFTTFAIPGVTIEQDQASDPTIADYRACGQATGEAVQAMAVAGEFGEFVLAETAALTLTGNDATTSHQTPNIVMTADTAALSLTGNTAATTRAITLPAEAGSIVLTGNAATFVRTTSNTLTAEAGTLSLTGNAATTTDSITAAREGMIGVNMRRHLEVSRGQSLAFSGVVRDADGTPINITNDTLVWKIGSNDMKSTIVTLTEGDGITKTDAANGKWSISLEGAKTDGQPPGHYRHQGEGAFGALPYGFVSGRLWLRRDLP